jgi:hypothetical protein
MLTVRLSLQHISYFFTVIIAKTEAPRSPQASYAVLGTHHLDELVEFSGVVQVPRQCRPLGKSRGTNHRHLPSKSTLNGRVLCNSEEFGLATK